MFGEGWIITFGLLLLIGVVTRQGGLVAIGTLVLLAGGVAWVWNRFSLFGVTYERKFSENRAFIGETIDLAIRVTNKKPLPLNRLEVEDDFPKELEVQRVKTQLSARSNTLNLRHSASMGWYERITWNYKVRCNTRGYYSLGPATIKSGDLFGFRESSLQVPQVDRIIVYRRTVPLPQVRLPAGRPLGEMRGGEPIFEDPTRIMGLRDYRYNDPLKRVDWKATSRRQALQVKVFEPSVTHQLLILLNLDTVGKTWEGYDPVLLERAITAAASAARLAFEEKHTVGLYANGASLTSNQHIRVPLSRDHRQLNIILEALAMAGPFVHYSMEEIIRKEGRFFPFGSTVVLVTALMPEPLASALLYLRGEGYPVVVFSVANERFGTDLRGIPIYEMGAYLRDLEVMGFGVAG